MNYSSTYTTFRLVKNYTEETQLCMTGVNDTWLLQHALSWNGWSVLLHKRCMIQADPDRRAKANNRSFIVGKWQLLPWHMMGISILVSIESKRWEQRNPHQMPRQLLCPVQELKYRVYSGLDLKHCYPANFLYLKMLSCHAIITGSDTETKTELICLIQHRSTNSDTSHHRCHAKDCPQYWNLHIRWEVSHPVDWPLLRWITRSDTLVMPPSATILLSSATFHLWPT